jgi:hypothetical protein
MMYNGYAYEKLGVDKGKSIEAWAAHERQVREALAGRKPEASALLIKAIAQVIARVKNALAAKLAQDALKPKPHHGIG